MQSLRDRRHLCNPLTTKIQNYAKASICWRDSYAIILTYHPQKTVNGILPAQIRAGYIKEEPIYTSEDEFNRIVQNMKTKRELKELAIGMYHTHWRIISNADDRLGSLEVLIHDIRSEFERLK